MESVKRDRSPTRNHAISVGREVVVAVGGGWLDSGPWEQIFYGELDGRRPKRVLIEVIGESAAVRLDGGWFRPYRLGMLERLLNQVAIGVLRLPSPLGSILAGGPVIIEGQKLDPQVQLLLRLMALQGGPQINEVPPAQGREMYRMIGPMLGGRPADMATVAGRRIPGPGGEIPIRIYSPKSAPASAPVLVYYHGGGWVIGDLDTHDGPCRDLAQRAGCVVVAVDYRLAPEHRFPAAAEDAFAAWRWVVDHAGEIGGDPQRMAVAGDSAGGNLSTVVCQMARDQGVRMPVLQALVYPTTDLSTEHPSWETFREGFFLTRDLMRWFRDQYVAEAERHDVRASPLHAETLSGLPPACITVAGFDPLRDEGIEYAMRLEAAGVPVTLHRHGELIHGWISMIGVIRAAERAFDDVVAALRRAFD